MKQIEKIIGILLLLFAIGFNLWIYRLEPAIKVDPNDNTFQYALVDRTNQIWDFANKICTSKFGIWDLGFGICHQSYLVDHWVPNWAQGYNLPYYYSHIPQITIVASWRLLSLFTTHYSLFSYYHIIIYLLLCFFPLSLFLSVRIIGLSWISAGVGALIASHLSTDGLYGLDPSSFLYRGYGLSSQLFAMIWLPLAIAYAYKYFQEIGIKNKDLGINTPHSYLLNLKSAVPSILLLTAVTAGHLGIGIIAFMSVGVMFLSHLRNLNDLEIIGKKLLFLFGGVFLLLGYWILPILLFGNYHNISVWDPIWKFDSYGYKEVLTNLFNGNLFDFGRFPVLTIATFIGMYCAVSEKIVAAGFPSFIKRESKQENPASSRAKQFFDEQQHNYLPFAALFLFWLLFYFGRTTWGGLVNLIPSMEEFHLSRFIVGLHLSGLFLIPIGIDRLIGKTRLLVPRSLGVVGLVLLIIFGIFPQTIRYATHNDTLIKQANDNVIKNKSDTDSLIVHLNSYLLTNPGRVYAGRGGGWGKDFRVAETPMFMYISTYGIPTLTWLPQTWSPNSDTEQYFSEDVASHYTLYNIKYVVTPIKMPNGEPVKPQPFWKPLTAGETWKLYEVHPEITKGSSGYISTGVRPAIVSSAKQDFTNVVRLWIQSDIHTKNLYPELTFDKDYPKKTGLPNFRMVDEVTYRVPSGTLHNLFAEPPLYLSPPSPAVALAKEGIPPITLISQSSDSDMIFRATVNVPEGCTECIVILHQTYHPSWKATVDGKPVKPFTVFPFYTAVKLEQAGTHEVIFSYQPSTLKTVLFVIGLLTLISLIFLACQVALKKSNPSSSPR